MILLVSSNGSFFEGTVRGTSESFLSFGCACLLRSGYCERSSPLGIPSLMSVGVMRLVLLRLLYAKFSYRISIE